MDKFQTRIISLIIAIATILSITACSEKAPKSDNNLNATGMPIVKEKITLKAMVMKIPLHKDFDNMDFTKIMEEKTNIKIEWQVVPLGQEVADKKALAFASGNMPDMFFITSNMTDYDIASYGPAGLLQPLNQLLKTYAPNIEAMFAKHPEVKINSTYEDGNIYSLPQVSDTIKNHGNYRTKTYINKKWLTNLGLSIPKTTDELYTVLKAFKTGDPNGNGLQDEIPFSSANIDPAMMGPWGLSYWWDMDMMTIKDDRKVSYVPMDPAFKQGLQYWHKLFAEGLLDNDVMSMTTDQLKQKLSATDEMIGCFMSFADFLDYGVDRAKDYEMLPPLSGPQGLKSYTNLSRGNYPPNYFVMSSTCKNKEAAMRWIDYLYSEEGTLLAWNGPDGKMYTVQPDGKIKDTANENVPKDASGQQMELNAWRYTLTPGYVLPFYMSQNISDRSLILDASLMSDQQKLGKQLNDLSYKYYDPVKPKYIMPSILFSKTDSQRIAELGSQVHPVFNTFFTQFVTGEASIDSQWDSYVANFKSLGSDEMVAIYQKYIDKVYPPK